MKICGEDCVPCCDYCKNVIHEIEITQGKITSYIPIGCAIYKDERHNKLVQSKGSCEDFYCKHYFSYSFTSN